MFEQGGDTEAGKGDVQAGGGSSGGGTVFSVTERLTIFVV